MPTDCELKVMQLAENCHRKSLSGWDKFVGATDILAMNPTMTAKKLAEKLKISPANIVRWLCPSRTVPEAQDALKARANRPVRIATRLRKRKRRSGNGNCLPRSSPAWGGTTSKKKAAGFGHVLSRRSKSAGRNWFCSSGISVVVSGAAICLETVIDPALSDAVKQGSQGTGRKPRYQSVRVDFEKQGKGSDRVMNQLKSHSCGRLSGNS